MRCRVKKGLGIEADEEATAKPLVPNSSFEENRPLESYRDLTGSKMMADLSIVVVVQGKPFFIFAV